MKYLIALPVKKHPREGEKKEKGSPPGPGLWAGWGCSSRGQQLLASDVLVVWPSKGEEKSRRKKKKEVRIKATTRRASGRHNCGLGPGAGLAQDVPRGLSSSSQPVKRLLLLLLLAVCLFSTTLSFFIIHSSNLAWHKL